MEKNDDTLPQSPSTAVGATASVTERTKSSGDQKQEEQTGGESSGEKTSGVTEEQTKSSGDQTEEHTGGESSEEMRETPSYQVIAILTGFAIVFAPVNFVLKTVRNSGAGNQVEPAVIVESMVMTFLQDYENNVVYPFLGLAMAYGLLYTASAAAIPMILVLIADILSIAVGFVSSFYLMCKIWRPLALIGGPICGVPLIVLVCLQYPRERVREPRDIARP